MEKWFTKTKTRLKWEIELIDIDVEDDTKYSIQINAFEDRGVLGGEDNWSNEIHITTAKGMATVNYDI